jgi:hypothetical protein
MLGNGNVLICEGQSGRFLEVDSNKNMVWEYVNPVGATGPVDQGTQPTMSSVFRCNFYRADYTGFNGHTLAAGNPIELNPLAYTCTLNVEDTATGFRSVLPEEVSIYPNPATDKLYLKGIASNDKVMVYNSLGELIYQGIGTNEISVDAYTAGIYFLQVQTTQGIITKKVICSR